MRKISKKNLISLIFLCACYIYTGAQGFCAVDYENFAPAPFMPRAGVGMTIEGVKSVTVKKPVEENKVKQIEVKTKGKDLTYADLSLKQISKDVVDEMDFESPEILANLSILYNSAVQRSETIRYAIYKLSNPDDKAPKENAVKRMLKPIASFSTIAGTALSANPYMASGALIGGGLLNAFSGGGDKEANLKFTKVNDADMVLLVKKIDELQKNLLINYMNYCTQKELYELSMKNLENRRKIYTMLQNNPKTTREELIVADTYYRNAQNTAKKARADFNLSRVILENIAGEEAVREIEKEEKK